MASSAWKSRFIHYFLSCLIVCFFAIPLTAWCIFESKLFPARRIASLLLIFFR